MGLGTQYKASLSVGNLVKRGILKTGKMNKDELKKELDRLNVSQDKYSLEGSIANWYTIALVQDYKRWKVIYVDERGHQEELKAFEKEDDACLYIYNEFKKIIDM
jgi:hypothetical protein